MEQMYSNVTAATEEEFMNLEFAGTNFNATHACYANDGT